jgi:hypothetical protein
MAGTKAPQLFVEIRGAENQGKTVVAQLLRRVLVAERITAIGPPRADRLAAADLRDAIRDLIARGLSVEIIKTETAGPIRPKQQIEARPPQLRPGRGDVRD